jgi:serine/threonine protein kinase
MVGIGGTSKDTLRLPANWRVLKALGTGGFGVVASVDTAEDSGRCAVKKIIGAGTTHRRALLALRELRLQLHCSEHSSILPIEKVLPLVDDGLRDIYMVMPEGEMSLDRLVPVASAQREEFFEQLLSGLAYMHSASVAHRDLKPSNCMVVQGKLKIGDFGAARVLEDDTWSPQKSPRITTHSYTAPEVLLAEFGQRTQVGTLVDIWAAGCIYYEMGTGTVLFGGAGRDRRVVLQLIARLVGSPNNMLQLPGCHTAHEQYWISRLLSYQPEQRPSAKSVLWQMYGINFESHVKVAQDDKPGDDTLEWSDLKTRVEEEQQDQDTITYFGQPPQGQPHPQLTHVMETLPDVYDRSELRTPEYWTTYTYQDEHSEVKGRASPPVPELNTPEIWPSSSHGRL